MKLNVCFRLSGLVFMFFLIMPNPILSQTNSELRITLDYSRFDLDFSEINDYDLVLMKDAGATSELGAPVIPVRSVRVAIPAGTMAYSIKAKSISSYEIAGEFLLLPGQSPRKIGMASAEPIEPPNKRIYSSKQPYPGNLASLQKQGNLAGQQIAEVAVYPLQYLPATKKVILHNRIELSIACVPSNVDNDIHTEKYYKFSALQKDTYEKMIKAVVVNPEQVTINPMAGTPSALVPPGQFDHVIITSSALAQYFEPLTYWNTRKGIKDTVVTIEWIYSNYAGPGDTLQVRQFVIDANANWGTMYFLMGGEDEIVPFAYHNYIGEVTPSDQYYSDFDDDWLNEAFVGRAPVEDETQINIFINKVLKYEKFPPLSNYPLDVLLIGMDLDAYTPCEALKEQIRTYLPLNINVHMIYDSHGGNHADTAIFYLNSGQNLVNHADHANTTIMGVGDFNHGWYIDIPDVNGLTNNDESSIIVSSGCLANSMDYNDCIAEYFVVHNDNQAGVAFIGNTRDGYYYQGNPYALTSELDRWWWHGLFTQNQDDLGGATVYSKHQFNQAASNTHRHCEWTWSLQGEPAMPVWTDTPESMLVAHAPFVPAASGSFLVTVKENDGVTPISDARVCCWIPGQQTTMHVTAQTNSSGQASLNISPTTPGDTMLITATKKNFIPCESFAVVTVLSGPFILAGTMLVDPNGNNQVNPGEDVDLGIYAKNIGVDTAYAVFGMLSETDPYITINVDSSWYSNIAPDGDSSLSNPYYQFAVANNCPNGYVMQFDLEFQDSGTNVWTAHPEFLVYAPVLTYQDVDVVGGTWDNGILDPSETAGLAVTIMNEGGADAENVDATLTSSSAGISIIDNTSNFGTVQVGNTISNTSDPFMVYASSGIPFGTLVDFSVIVQSGVYVDTLDFSITIGQSVPTDTGYYYAYYSGGPHAECPTFGWIAIDSTQSANPGVSLDLDRNETEVVGLPFIFRYYGVDYDRISICSNGWIALDSTDSYDFSNTMIPNSDGPPAMIAGIWDYLDPGSAGEPSDIYYYHDSANNRFIVEYFMIEHYPSGGNYETFEIILHDPVHYTTPTGDGEIIVQYFDDVQLASSMTVGIENYIETVGIQYNYSNVYDSLAVPITNSFAIRYTTFSPTPGLEEYGKLDIMPSQTRLAVIHPNPFLRRTTISYQLAARDQVSLKVYDVSGRLIAPLVEGVMDPGYYSISWDACDDNGRKMPSGVYFIRLNAGDHQQVHKTVLLK